MLLVLELTKMRKWLLIILYAFQNLGILVSGLNNYQDFVGISHSIDFIIVRVL